MSRLHRGKDVIWEVFRAATMKTIVIWHVMPCGLVHLQGRSVQERDSGSSIRTEELN
jgi:hypothetical protein